MTRPADAPDAAAARVRRWWTGNIYSGAFDPFAESVAAAHAAGGRRRRRTQVCVAFELRRAAGVPEAGG